MRGTRYRPCTVASAGTFSDLRRALAIDATIALRSDIGIDRSISDLGAEDDLLPVLIEDAVADPENYSNPKAG